MRSKFLWTVLTLAVVLGVTTVASATTSGLITGKMIAPHSINSKKLVDHTIKAHDLSPGLVKALHGVSKLEADGPYPSLTQLSDYPNAGANSEDAWVSDPTGTTLQSSWVMCAPGKVALGGGFGQNDYTSSKLVIVTSTPYYIDPVTLKPGTPPPADDEYSIVPNAWLVQGYNMSDSSLVVRPWVVCAKVAS